MASERRGSVARGVPLTNRSVPLYADEDVEHANAWRQHNIFALLPGRNGVQSFVQMETQACLNRLGQ
jgi:hypothetical protein